MDEEVKEKLSFERRKRTSAHKGRMALPEHLEVREIEIYPEEDITGMVRIGQEVTDELEYEPAKYYIKRFIRHKYASKDGEKVKKHEVNPYEWFKYTLENIMDMNHKDIHILYPQNYKKQQEA